MTQNLTKDNYRACNSRFILKIGKITSKHVIILALRFHILRLTTMTHLEMPFIATFIGYIVIILAIAYISTKLTKNLSDYLLAGRKLNGLVTGLAAGTSDMGAWLLLAVPGMVYISGLNKIWLPIGLVIGAYCNWRFTAKRLRVYTEVASDSLTIPEFLSNRFKENGIALRIVISLALIIFFSFYAAANLRSGAILIQTLFVEIDFLVALLIVASVIVTYTMLGGFLAVSWVDCFQGGLMFIALLVVPIVTCMQMGGIEDTWQRIALASPPHLNMWQDIKLLGMLSMLAWGLGYFGQLHINTRFMAIRSTKELPTAWRICITWMSFALLGAIATGLFGFIYFIIVPLQDPNTTFIVLTKQLFNPWIAGILLSAVSAAIMNAVSAQILMSASILVEDFYHGIFRKNASDKENLLASRILLLIVAGISVAIAASPNQSIFKAVGFAWAGLGSAFGPVLLFSLYWRRMNINAAIWGIISGAGMVILWEVLSHPNINILNHPDIIPGFAMIPGFLTSASVIWLVGINTAPPSAAVLKEFDKTMKIIA